MSERIDRLKKFLNETPGDPFLNHALALEYVKIEQDENARQYFEKNIAQSPEYVATYYHLAKLLERVSEQQAAINTYERGMQVAKAAGDMHTYNELQGAYEDLVY